MSWSRVVPEKLLFAQQVKKFLCEISGSHGGEYEEDSFVVVSLK
jgi:hypothetical protein